MTVETKISDDRIRSLLCSAFEGGSNYWYMHEGEKLAPGLTYQDFRTGGKMQFAEYWHPWQLIPLVDGCSLILSDKEEDDGPNKQTWILDRAAIDRGLQTLAAKYPHHFADILDENDDANTGDAFLQCCLFGELVYG